MKGGGEGGQACARVHTHKFTHIHTPAAALLDPAAAVPHAAPRAAAQRRCLYSSHPLRHYTLAPAGRCLLLGCPSSVEVTDTTTRAATESD